MARPGRGRASCLVVGTGLIGTSVALALRRHDVVGAPGRPGPGSRPAGRRAGRRHRGPADRAGGPRGRRGQPVGHRRGRQRAAGRQRRGHRGRHRRGQGGGAARGGGHRRPGPALRRHPPDGRPRAVRARGRAGRPVRGASLGGLRRRGRRAVDGRGCAPCSTCAARWSSSWTRPPTTPRSPWSRTSRRSPPRWWPPGWPRAPTRALALTGQGLRDVTRVAASDPDLWVDILTANAEPVARILTELRQDVDAVVHALREVDEDPEWARTALREVLLRGNAGRARLPGKHGGRSTTYALVPVVLPDRPGELARLFVDVGRGRRQHRGHPHRALAGAAGGPGGAVRGARRRGAGLASRARRRLGWVVHPEGA